MFITKWATPKRVQMEEEKFLALLPQEQTILGAGTEVYTPFCCDKESQSGIFHTLGFSRKLDLIHQETDDVVKEIMQNGIVYTNKPKYQHRSSPQHSVKCHGTNFSQRLSQSQTSKCQDLFTAKDEIIQQKDIIMQKQKNIINQLRQRNIELEEQLIQNDQMQLKAANFKYFHQEHQQQIQCLQQEISDSHSRKCTEVERLQRKLGECEYEIGKLQIALKESRLTKENAFDIVMKEFEHNKEKLLEEQDRVEKLKVEIKRLRQENTKLQAYLEELPTSAEFKKIKKEIKEISQEYLDLKENNEKIQSRHKEIKDSYIQKNSECKDLQKLTFDLKEEISCLNTTFPKYHSNDPVSVEDHELNILEITKLEKENKELRESLHKRQKKMTRLHYDYMTKQKEMDEEKKKLVDTIKSINEKLHEKQTSISKLNARNQELLSSSLEYEAQVKKYKEMYNKEYQTVLQSVFSETMACTDDVKSFVNLCTSLSEGGHPTLNALLGLKDSPNKPGAYNEEVVVTDSTHLKEMQKALKEVRKEVENLRHLVSEQYADEIGQNCITQ